MFERVVSNLGRLIGTIPALYRRPKDDTKYNPQIDGLRCLAVASVLLWHGGLRMVRHGDWIDPTGRNTGSLYRFLPHGEIGVVLFFMISGLIIAKPFLSQPDRRIVLGKFYYRRIHRIYPPYIIALVLFSIPVFLDFVHANHAWVISPTESFLASLFYVHGIVWNASSMFIPPLWSLEVEVQFYLLFPLMMWIYRAMGPSRIAATMTAMVLYVAVLGYVHSVFPFDGRFRYGVFAHLPYFVMGIVVADLVQTYGYAMRTSPRRFDLVFAVGIVLFLLVGLAFTRVNAEARQAVPYSGLEAAAIVACALVMLGAMYGGRCRRIFANSWICLTGTMCYSIYLVHVPLMEAIERLVLHHLPLESVVPWWAVDAMILFPSVWVAGLAYYILVERPFMNRETRPAPVVPAGGTPVEGAPALRVSGPTA
ncbi:acyltransferase 3 [Gluconacetobacter diazotrophicus PA1 5]|uniref:acyltransferase family protein n=1 Tax=Gluconacetobacter diazotrophicus TaxID=33996 RepID=UPI000173B016|nr:acyltransferase [Gluconacetobacter diazotrophicus]ACI51632.1 acyltransferase 3 [Gluconacetobacter diazotrophicus PA1 5]TWB02825.1 peptidoglycan/LPS O-acetylase OafA/YrhL [Gluconacetobacter diazotrophicus]